MLPLLQFHTITTLRTVDVPQKSHGVPRPDTKMLGAILTDKLNRYDNGEEKMKVNVRGEERTNIKM